jgi:hypothetical protein
MSEDSSDWADGWMTPNRVKGTFSFPELQEQFWGPPTLLYTYRGSWYCPPGVKAARA